MIYSNTGKIIISDEYCTYFNKKHGCRVVQTRGLNNATKKLKLDIKSHIVNERLSSYCINDSDSLLKHIRLTESKFAMLDEGLIATYPTKTTINNFKHVFSKIIDKTLVNATFPDSTEKIIDFVEMSDPNEDISPLIMFAFPTSNNENLIEQQIKLFSEALLRCGYYMTSYDVEEHDDFDIVYMQFEAKYTNMLTDMSSILYHVSPKKHLNKILKTGLSPHSKSTHFKYDPRVYLFNKCPKDLIYKYAIHKLDPNEHEFCVFKILKDKLLNDPLFRNGKQKLYLDPSFSMSDTTDNTALFTYGNIPLRVIDDEYVIVNVDNDKKVVSEQVMHM